MGFSIYTNSSSLLPQFKTYYASANSNDILIDDEYDTPPRVYLSYWDHATAFPRLVLANNYSELTSTTLSVYVNDVPLAKAFNFSSTDYLAYDAEDWTLTPLSEQLDQQYYVQEACNFVHSAGYKFGYTPEPDGTTGSQLPSVNWTCVDFFDIQAQGWTGNTASLVQNATYLVSLAKPQNPNPNMNVLKFLRERADTKGDHQMMEHIERAERLLRRGTATAHLAKKEEPVDLAKVPSSLVAATSKAQISPTAGVQPQA